MSLAEALQPYDPRQALALASGNPVFRDRFLVGALEFLSPDGHCAALLDPGAYRATAGACQALAHRGTGLMRQAAMPELARLFQDLSRALEDRRFADAERLGALLPPAIGRAREAVVSASPCAV